jgi:hypothetical protein
MDHTKSYSHKVDGQAAAAPLSLQLIRRKDPNYFHILDAS